MQKRSLQTQGEVTACEPPAASQLDRRMLVAAYFCDAYRVPLRRPVATAVECFAAILGQLPWWMKLALLTRNACAAAIGLKVPNRADMLRPELSGPFEVGQLIGPWPIYAISDGELIAGEDNRHLDFRLSVWVRDDAQGTSVVLTTVCKVHGRFGKVYLFFIVPFHKWALRRLMSRAVDRHRM